MREILPFDKPPVSPLKMPFHTVTSLGYEKSKQDGYKE
jgi:hypothetical protein